jgi:hypothetical protein
MVEFIKAIGVMGVGMVTARPVLAMGIRTKENINSTSGMERVSTSGRMVGSLMESFKKINDMEKVGGSGGGKRVLSTAIKKRV